MQALLRYPGAKWSIADKITALFPKHKGYLEAFFGSGAILFSKEKSRLETINDIDGEVVNFFKVLKNNYNALEHELKYTPYSREVYYQTLYMIPKTDYERAYKFFVLSWMSHGGYQRHKTGWSHSKCPKGPNKATIFKNVISSLEEFSERLKEVQIENYDALELIKLHDYKDNLIYLDPPYLLNTRNSKMYYHHETDNDFHENLLEIILNLKKAKVLLSGYDNELYNDYLSAWNKKEFNSLDGAANIKQECVWFNYDLTVQQTLF